ncbi:hypothetical protein AAVH_17768 [Aphelenchoides avenae]|nr:hypothetical protein AAVH_17768 [Aphelenchus avenae]
MEVDQEPFEQQKLEVNVDPDEVELLDELNEQSSEPGSGVAKESFFVPTGTSRPEDGPFRYDENPHCRSICKMVDKLDIGTQ